MFEKYKRRRSPNGTFRKDNEWTFWNEAWEYRMNDDIKSMLEKTLWTFRS